MTGLSGEQLLSFKRESQSPAGSRERPDRSPKARNRTFEPHGEHAVSQLAQPAPDRRLGASLSGVRRQAFGQTLAA
jgi:hypothetical protein